MRPSGPGIIDMHRKTTTTIAVPGLKAPVILALLLTLAVLAGCASSGRLTPDEMAIFTTVEAAEQDPGSRPKYIIGPGDVISISVWGNSDLSLSVPVRPDGFISMPLVGDVRAENIDAEGLAQVVTELLEAHLRNPQVTVIINQVNSGVYTSRVRVTGAVRRPLSMPHARGMSVLDLILEAGGISEMASPNKTRLYRMVDGRLYEAEIRLDDILLRGNLDTNYAIKPGDVLTIPERLL